MAESIDLVYTWCDAADDTWRTKKDATAQAWGLTARSRGNAACRFAGNDEIRYALRSAERCVPWVRCVHLVIDDDITPPRWLRLDHPKLHLVRLSEIMPAERLPCFCSGTIEHHLPNIPDLAARFIYSNDDCLFFRPLTPRFFFARDGYPYFRFGGVRHPTPEEREANLNYNCNLEAAERLIRAAYPHPNDDLAAALERYPHHGIDAYVTDDARACFSRFEAALAPTFKMPFRTPDKVQRALYAFDALARGHGHFRRARFYLQKRRRWYKELLWPSYADSLQFYGERWKTGLDDLARFRPGVFCFNDTETVTDADRRWLRSVYERLLPVCSSFEKAEAAE